MKKLTVVSILTVVGAVITFVLYGFKVGNFTDPVAWSGLITVVAGLFGLANTAAAKEDV